MKREAPRAEVFMSRDLYRYPGSLARSSLRRYGGPVDRISLAGGSFSPRNVREAGVHVGAHRLRSTRKAACHGSPRPADKLVRAHAGVVVNVDEHEVVRARLPKRSVDSIEPRLSLRNSSTTTIRRNQVFASRRSMKSATTWEQAIYCG